MGLATAASRGGCCPKLSFFVEGFGVVNPLELSSSFMRLFFHMCHFSNMLFLGRLVAAMSRELKHSLQMPVALLGNYLQQCIMHHKIFRKGKSYSFLTERAIGEQEISMAHLRLHSSKRSLAGMKGSSARKVACVMARACKPSKIEVGTQAIGVMTSMKAWEHISGSMEMFFRDSAEHPFLISMQQTNWE